MDFDVIMPLTLFIVAVVAMILHKKAEGKLKQVLEEKEFRVRDTILLVASISVTVSLIVLVPQFAIMIIFLFSYSMLLFMFGYLFSDAQKEWIVFFLGAISAINIIAAITSITVFRTHEYASYGAFAFSGLSIFAVAATIHEAFRTKSGERWYVGVLPPALFVGFYAFFSRTPIWFPYLLNSYALTFAILIILYLSTLFKWKTTMIFAGLLTVMDIVLVLFTKTMVSAAQSVTTLRLPVLVSLPTLPALFLEGHRLYMSLGLGDFFFAGLLTIQTFKRYGRKTAILTALIMTVSFFIFEVYMLNFALVAFPGTLMIICGWAAAVAGLEIVKKLAGKTPNPSS
jgi:hypothetical protein